MWRNLTELVQQAKADNNKIVAVANGADKGVLSAVKIAVDEGLCSFLLFGAETDIRKLAEVVDLNLLTEAVTIIHREHNTASAAVKAVHDRKADILMKGNVSTKNLLKAVLDKEFGLRTGNSLSHVALFDIPNQNRLIFLTDAAMNIAPDLEGKRNIVQNAVQVAHGVGFHNPKAAVLGAVETVNADMQATVDAAALTQMQKRNQITGCTVDGPLALDNAISENAVRQKGITSDVAGDADILVVPTIEAGNMLYKSLMYFSDANVAAVISGARAPIVLTSRTDSSESKLYSLALALVSEKTFRNN
ncbi:phosphate butyryltransferase [Lentibacillus sp. CBA3610]|uniref:phosphate butyryltransferase n=1 Tax=Lentibacillus sp. CBA3610 TaxID=2518176 RepID=UPI00159621AF|nr:phosphate butyryltransferase [Lentibacillus sp. CBA3610]QKY71626.1 phosphate butyryltransferase [Lentibacillus sp. CBA3610]